jgi:hypothetical protein
MNEVFAIVLLCWFVISFGTILILAYQQDRAIGRLSAAIDKESGGDVHKKAAMWRDTQRRLYSPRGS